MVFRVRGLSVLVLASTVVLLAAGGAGAGEVELAPHRAFYKVEMVRARPRGDIAGVSGAMEVSLGKACDGWHLSQRMVLDLESAEGEPVRQDMAFAAWESRDTRHFRFNARERFDDETQTYRGTAERLPDGGGHATFTVPESWTLDLPRGVMFPVSHTRALILAAKDGRRRVFAPVFDGAVGKGAQDTVTFIGQPVDDLGPRPDGDAHLVTGPGWPVRTAYFDPEERDASPDFEVGLLQLGNGVAVGITLDYEQFSLRLRLERIEALPEPDC